MAILVIRLTRDEMVNCESVIDKDDILSLITTGDSRSLRQERYISGAAALWEGE